jgi:acetyltransferase-like isoleucine patch superfamily enzyme
MCTILTGAEMGMGCLLASNSVLNSPMPNYTIFGGTPAKQIGLVSEKKSNLI